MQERVRFSSGELTLEGVVHRPEGRNPPWVAVVVCHPHPLYGGTMNNNVVRALCSGLVERGLLALRFNFRGVGRSGGAYGEGVLEQQDVRAAVTFATSLEGVDPHRLGLVGYSFGARVALLACSTDERVAALVAVSLPLDGRVAELLSGCDTSKLFVWGREDHLASPEAATRFLDQVATPRQHLFVSGADHFWQGQEGELAASVVEFLAASLGL